MKRNLLIVLVLFSVVFTGFSQTKISDSASKYIQSFLDFRAELTQYQKDKPKAVTALNQFKEKNPYGSFSEQEQLIIESFILCELFNYVYEDKSYDGTLKKDLYNLMQKCEAYIKANPGNISDWMYLMTADCISCYMAYSPVSGAIKYGLKVKKYYEESLAVNPKNSVCLTHYSQWFYWAPAINGGSKKKAKGHLENAIACATTNADKFYAEIYYSQILYELGDKAAAATHLTKAKSYYPKTMLVKELEECNAEGYSIFTNSRRKAESSNRME